MSFVNEVRLMGNAGGDPDIRVMPSGGKVANFSLATNKRWKDRNGEYCERTDWHRIVVFGPLVEALVEKHIKKGSHLYVGGELRERAYTTKDGEKRRAVEIVAEHVRLLDSRAADGSIAGTALSPPPTENIPHEESEPDEALGW